MNVLLKLQYDGTDFCGSQIQPGVRTVQGALQSALHELTGEDIRTVFSGRTDTGVHAMEQCVNFSLPSSCSIPADKISYPLNTLLPSDINAVSSEEVSETFNARFDAKKRTYRYYIRTRDDLFRRKYTLLVPNDIDIDKLNSASHLFTGKKDFRSFCSAHAEVNNHFCSVSDLRFLKENGEFFMEISSDRFLQNMVRIIVSAFLDLNSGRISSSDISEMFLEKDRRCAPKTISPKGLFLWKVLY